MTVIEYEQGDSLTTTSNRCFTVTNVSVTTDGKTVDYELQELDATGNTVGEPAWYSSKQLVKKGSRVRLDLEFEEETKKNLLDAFKLIDGALVSVNKGLGEHEAISRVHEGLQAMLFKDGQSK